MGRKKITPGSEKIDSNWKHKLSLVHSTNPNSKGPELLEGLRKVVEKGTVAPGLRAVQAALPKIKEDYERMKKKGEDEPWDLAAINKDYPILPEAMPIVLNEYKNQIDNGKILTIRQAKWITRLYSIGISHAYIIAKVEQFYELAGMKVDLEGYTKLLSGFEKIQDNNWIYLLASASVAGILKNDPTKRGGKK